MYNPLEQFFVNPLIHLRISYLDATITNVSFFMVLSISLYLVFYSFSHSDSLLPSKFRYIFYRLYTFTSGQFMEMLGKEANIYFPLINGLFIFILVNNLIGLVPYSFTTTSQIWITLTLSIIMILGVTFLGFYKYRANFYKVFLPKGVPSLILPVIFLIEIMSYLSRIISLSVRLFANMVAGHTILYIIATAGGVTLSLTSLVLLIPLFFILILELGVAIIQAFVFAVLSSTYIRDMVDLH